MIKKFLVGTFAVAALAFALTVSAAYDFGTTTLKVGSTGPAVMTLQTLVGVTADGAFGPMTKAKVMVWQAANGLTADGVFGPASMAKANMVGGPVQGACPAGYVATTPTAPLFASCVVATPAQGSCPAGYVAVTPVAPTFAACAVSGTTPVVVGGGEGEIADINEVSSADSTLEEGKSAQLMAFTAEIDGDVSIDRVDVYAESDSVASENADDYFKSASLLVNGTKVATVDTSDFDENDHDVITNDSTDEFKIRFSSLNLTFKDGDEPKFVIEFEANSTIDSADQASDWTVGLASDSIRFVDGKGFSDTDGDTGVKETFGMDAQEVAKLTINSSSNDLDASVIEVSDTEETKEVVVFKFEIEEENDVDATIEDMTLTVTTGAVSGETDETAVVSDAYLYMGSTLLGSETVGVDGEVNFENLGLEISAGDTEELTVKLTFADQSAYAQGTDVAVEVTTIDDASDENGNDEGDMTISGEGLDSETHTLRTTGLMIKGISENAVRSSIADATGEFDQGTFTLVFELTAFGDDIYVDNTTPVEDNAAGYVATSTSYSITNDTTNSSVGVLNATSGDFTSETNSWLIKDGKTARFTLEVTATAGSDTSAAVTLENIGYALTDVDGTTSFLVPALSEYQTNSITLLAF